MYTGAPLKIRGSRGSGFRHSPAPLLPTRAQTKALSLSQEPVLHVALKLLELSLDPCTKSSILEVLIHKCADLCRNFSSVAL